MDMTSPYQIIRAEQLILFILYQERILRQLICMLNWLIDSGGFKRTRQILSIQNIEAHNAGITCMSLMVDDERNVFVLTGSYDKVVKET